MEKTVFNMSSFAITGPESTGKSELSTKLANQFGTVYLPEFARGYLQQHGPAYTYETVVFIAEQQLIEQNRLLEQGISPCFFDTDLLVCRIWLEFVFGKCPSHIFKASNEAVFTHTLLMDIDLPWQDDPLREHPAQRNELFELYQRALEHSGRAYTVISGIGEDRFLNALRVVNEQLKK